MSVWIGLTAGNFFYEYVFKDAPSLAHCIMLSFYQGSAILTYWYFDRK